jgi:hypothetical protein
MNIRYFFDSFSGIAVEILYTIAVIAMGLLISAAVIYF